MNKETAQMLLDEIDYASKFDIETALKEAEEAYTEEMPMPDSFCTVLAYAKAHRYYLNAHQEADHVTGGKPFNTDGHKKPCVLCGKICNAGAASPSDWPNIFPKPDGTGVCQVHCMGCVVAKVYPEEADQGKYVDVETLKKAFAAGWTISGEGCNDEFYEGDVDAYLERGFKKFMEVAGHLLQPPPPAIESVNGELLEALKVLLNATMYKDHPAESDMAIAAISRAEAAMKPAYEGIEGLDEAIANWEDLDGPDFTAVNINRGVLRRFIKAAKRYARQRASAAIPPGFVLVPREPTEAMVEAGQGDDILKDYYVRACYAAMIEAAAIKDGGE